MQPQLNQSLAFNPLDIFGRKSSPTDSPTRNATFFRVATIGDARNDIQMIMEYEGYSMETAEEDVKKVASKIFVSVADILKYLEK